MTQLPFSEATVVVFTAPIFTAIFAHVFMNESVDSTTAGLMALSSVGVCIVARPPFLGFEVDPRPPYATLPRGFVVTVGQPITLYNTSSLFFFLQHELSFSEMVFSTCAKKSRPGM